MKSFKEYRQIQEKATSLTGFVGLDRLIDLGVHRTKYKSAIKYFFELLKKSGNVNPQQVLVKAAQHTNTEYWTLTEILGKMVDNNTLGKEFDFRRSSNRKKMSPADKKAALRKLGIF